MLPTVNRGWMLSGTGFCFENSLRTGNIARFGVDLPRGGELRIRNRGSLDSSV